MTPGPGATWYRATAPPRAPRPALSGSVRADVCVVGAGLAGLTAALELSRRGVGVAVVEAGEIACGASGRNGGFVVAGFAEDISRVARKLGPEGARALYQLSRTGVQYVREQIDLLDPSIRMGEGFVSARRYADEDGCRRHAQRARDDFGHALEFWPAARVRRCLVSPRYHCAVYDPDAFHIHPLRYALALAAEIERGGATIFESSPAVRLERSDPGFVVATPGGRVHAGEAVVVCTGPGRGPLSALSRAVLPVSTHVVVSAPAGDALAQVVRTGAAVADDRRAGDYYRVVDGGRLLWGGKISTRRSPPRNLPGLMRRTMAEAFPQLADLAIEYAWSGLMAYCRHRMPVIGELEPGVWAASGFGGHGLNTTAMAGCLIASALAEGDERWRAFTPYGPVWAGGALGRAGVQLGYWALQARDRLEERRGAR